MALDVRTGTLRWYAQLVPGDFHDWDLTQVSPLFHAVVRGTDRDLVAVSGKDGKVRLLDRASHRVLSETPVTMIRNADVPLGKNPVEFCPGGLGGVEWNGPAWSPSAKLLYVPAVDWCVTAQLDETVASTLASM